MFNLDFFFVFFSVCGLIASVLVIISKNPLHSIISLILVFCNIILILLLHEIEFIALIFLIVYIGAIAVLFLFVVYMLNIKLIELNEFNWQYLIGLFFSFVVLIFLYFYKHREIVLVNDFSFLNYFNWIFYLNDYGNLKLLAILILENFYLIFIIIGLILLVAMVGVIALIVKKTYSIREQSNFEQIQRFIKIK